MPYRNQIASPDALDPALQKLVRLGRLRRMAKRERDTAAQEREQLEARKRASQQAVELKEERRVRQLRSISAWHWLLRPGWALLTSLYIAVSAAPFFLIGTVGLIGWLILGVFVATPIALCLWSYRHVRRAMRAEQRFVEALPFTVVGHWGALSRNDGARTVRVRFAGRTPPQGLLVDALSAALPPGQVDRLELDGPSGTFSIQAPRTWNENNRGYHAWFHDLCELIVELGAAYPLVEVRVLPG